jgi:hypothetical protein
LSGLDCVPQLLGHRTWWEHHFLVEEYIEGTTLTDRMVQRNPLIHPDPSEADLSAYAVWALDVLDRIEAAITALHARGIVFGDLHPSNVLVRPDGRIALVDFELASHLDEQVPAGMGTPGYVAPKGSTGFAVDEYALACLRLALFLPLEGMLAWDPGKPAELARAVAERFPVPAGYVDSIVRVMAPDHEPVPPATPTTDAVRRGILANATPHRHDRLFPGDIEQFALGGLGLAYGAAGVLWALAETGAARSADHERWLLDAIARDRHPRTGFYDGLHGIAYALDRLDRCEEALDLLDRAPLAPADPSDVSLFGGLAGIGLNLMHFGHDDAAARITARVSELFSAGTVEARMPGLLFGWSGPALLAIRRYELTGEPELLKLAEAALRRDLDRCVWTEDRTLQVEDRQRVLPYLGTGSAGIGMVLHAYLGHRPAPDLASLAAGIRRACAVDLTVQSGLFNGRAGLIAYLRQVDGAPSPALDRHVRNLGWHAVPYRGATAFPGDHLLRLSMDLATGGAGVLVALGDAVSLPFLGAPLRCPVSVHDRPVHDRVPVPQSLSRR